MNFTVIWLPLAQNELAQVWLDATDRNAVTAASNRIDQRLAADPVSEGESRSADERITFDPPLRVVFRVAAATRDVFVLSVGRSGRRP
ncbi:MAG TPA: hypothetical protein VFG68_17985 [Fimbriiglobus sp.]|nr:hypothetical protein [Fimbriiglobus sp.]